jgi:hypothetical protein
LTTVTPSGAPLPRPVGFLFDDDQTVLVYSQPGARIRNISRTLNFGGDGKGGDIVVLSGTAEVVQSVPTAAEVPDCACAFAGRFVRHRALAFVRARP